MGQGQIFQAAMNHTDTRKIISLGVTFDMLKAENSSSCSAGSYEKDNRKNRFSCISFRVSTRGSDFAKARPGPIEPSWRNGPDGLFG